MTTDRRRSRSRPKQTGRIAGPATVAAALLIGLSLMLAPSSFAAHMCSRTNTQLMATGPTITGTVHITAPYPPYNSGVCSVVSGANANCAIGGAGWAGFLAIDTNRVFMATRTMTGATVFCRFRCQQFRPLPYSTCIDFTITGTDDGLPVELMEFEIEPDAGQDRSW